MRKFEQRVYLGVLKCFKVKADSLTMYNQDVWSFRNERPFRNVNFSVAAITLEITDDFTLKLLLQRIIDRLYIFDW